MAFCYDGTTAISEGARVSGASRQLKETDGFTAASTTETMESTVINAATAHVVAQASSGGISTADVFAAAITIFVFIIVPLLIWAVRSLINEGKRRTEDSLNMAATRKSNDDLVVLLKEHIEKEDAAIVEIREDVAGLKAIIRLGGRENGRH